MVGTTTEPAGEAIFEARDEYRRQNPHLFPYNEGVTKQGVVLPRECFAKKATLNKDRRTLPDLLSINGLGVSERVKDIIERLEPGVHQFVEVELFSKRGVPIADKYYAVSIGRVADGQVIDRFTTAQRRTDGRVAALMPNAHGTVCIDRNMTRDWHMWISVDVFGALTISDVFQEWLVDAGIPGLQFTYIAEDFDLK